MGLNIPYQIPPKEQKKIWNNEYENIKKQSEELKYTDSNDDVSLKMWNTFSHFYDEYTNKQCQKTGNPEDRDLTANELSKIKKEMKTTADSFEGSDAEEAKKIYSLYEKSVDLFTDPNSIDGPESSVSEKLELFDLMADATSDNELLPIEIGKYPEEEDILWF